AAPRHDQQSDRPGGGRGAREDRRARLHHPVHPAPAAGPLRAQGTGGGVTRLREMHSPRAWALLGTGVLILALLPVIGLPENLVPLFGKFLCFGISALAMDLVWGYAGILSLGHGLFFALGGYGMGMYLMRSIQGEGVYRSALPDFMVLL